MMTKMQFACEIMRAYGDVKKVDGMLQSEEYQLLSRFVRTDSKTDLINQMVCTYADLLGNRVLSNQGRELSDECRCGVKYEIEKLLKTTCDWYSITTTIEKIKKFGVEFMKD